MILEIIESKIYLKSNILWTDGMASQDRWRLANLVITNNKIAQKSIKGHITSIHGKHANFSNTNFLPKKDWHQKTRKRALKKNQNALN